MGRAFPSKFPPKKWNLKWILERAFSRLPNSSIIWNRPQKSKAKKLKISPRLPTVCCPEIKRMNPIVQNEIFTDASTSSTDGEGKNGKHTILIAGWTKYSNINISTAHGNSWYIVCVLLANHKSAFSKFSMNFITSFRRRSWHPEKINKCEWY